MSIPTLLGFLAGYRLVRWRHHDVNRQLYELRVWLQHCDGGWWNPGGHVYRLPGPLRYSCPEGHRRAVYQRQGRPQAADRGDRQNHSLGLPGQEIRAAGSGKRDQGREKPGSFLKLWHRASDHRIFWRRSPWDAGGGVERFLFPRHGPGGYIAEYGGGRPGVWHDWHPGRPDRHAAIIDRQSRRRRRRLGGGHVDHPVRGVGRQAGFHPCRQQDQSEGRDHAIPQFSNYRRLCNAGGAKKPTFHPGQDEQLS